MTDEEFAKTFPNMKWLLPDHKPSPPTPSWSELPGNAVPSAVNAATGLYEMARHPVRTLQALDTVAGGAMNLMGADEINAYLADRGLAVRRNPQDVAREEATATAVGQALKDRYWGLDNIKRTIITDPFGSALDVIGVATGVGGVVRGGLSVGSKASLAKTPGAALNAERVAAKEVGPTVAENSMGRTAAGESNTIKKVTDASSSHDMINPMIANSFDSARDATGIATDAAGLFREKLTVGSRTRPAESPGTPLNEKRLARQEFGQTIAENRRGTSGRGSTTRKIESGAGPSDAIPGQSFLTEGLGGMRHNYPPGYTVVDDIGTSLDSMPMKPRNKQPRVPLHDPPTTPQRPFEADYPTTPAHDETGRLLEDIDGAPITAQYVAGRQTLGGNDIGFDAKTLREIAQKLAEIQTVPQENLGGSFGKMFSGKGPKDIAVIQLARELPKRHMDRVLAHELGHGLHKKAGLPAIIDPVMRAELERNYSRLRTGIENPKKLTLPRDVHSNYHDPVASDRELVADGYFAALAYPSYAKEALPVAYATMREWIKSNPELAKVVINNSVAAATVAAALAAAGDHDEAKAKASPSRTPQGNLPGSQGSLTGTFVPFGPFGLASEATKAGAFGLSELAKILSRRGLSPQAPKNEKFKDIVQALVELRAKREPQLYGGPR